eukprot:GHVU01099578.1.p1 GENE.GHVU01099578.1~~GHVU01099578.1.p1  ORF type:complete len:148 (+),score=4.10 GHVU01099578.1:157-600(+)
MGGGSSFSPGSIPQSLRLCPAAVVCRRSAMLRDHKGNILYSGQYLCGSFHGLGVSRSVRRTLCRPFSPEPAVGPEPARGVSHSRPTNGSRRGLAHVSTRERGGWGVIRQRLKTLVRSCGATAGGRGSTSPPSSSPLPSTRTETKTAA